MGLTRLEKMRRTTGARGMAYVEVVVIVGIVLTLGLLVATRIGDGVKTKGQQQGACVESIDGC